MANRNNRDDRDRDGRAQGFDRRAIRGGAFGGDYARDDWPFGLGGDYALDDRRRGFAGDYARDPRWGGTGAAGDYFSTSGSGRGSSYLGHGPGQSRGALGGDSFESYRGRGPKNYQRSDERIGEDVNDVLTEDEWLDASAIEVSVKDAEVTLSGAVRDRQSKRRAEDLAERCPGVKDVHNRLRVDDASDDVHIGKASE